MEQKTESIVVAKEEGGKIQGKPAMAKERGKVKGAPAEVQWQHPTRRHEVSSYQKKNRGVHKRREKKEKEQRREKAILEMAGSGSQRCLKRTRDRERRSVGKSWEGACPWEWPESESQKVTRIGSSGAEKKRKKRGILGGNASLITVPSRGGIRGT